MAILDSPRRGRPKKESTMDAIALRLPQELADEIDLYLSALREQLPGLNITRADAFRQLLSVGLKTEKARLAI